MSDSKLKDILASHGWRCQSSSSECVLSDVQLADASWRDFSFDRVTFKQVELADVDLSGTSFNQVRMESTLITSKASPIDLGRFVDSHLESVTIRARIGAEVPDPQKQGVETSGQKRSRNTKEERPAVVISAINSSANEITLENLQWTLSGQGSLSELIAALEPDELVLNNVQVKGVSEFLVDEIEQASERLKRSRDDAFQQFPRDQRNPHNRRNPLSFITETYSHPATDGLASLESQARSMSQGVIVHDCRIHPLGPESILDCDPFTAKFLGLIRNEEREALVKIESILAATKAKLKDTVVSTIASDLDPAAYPQLGSALSNAQVAIDSLKAATNEKTLGELRPVLQLYWDRNQGDRALTIVQALFPYEIYSAPDDNQTVDWNARTIDFSEAVGISLGGAEGPCALDVMRLTAIHDRALRAEAVKSAIETMAPDHAKRCLLTDFDPGDRITSEATSSINYIGRVATAITSRLEQNSAQLPAVGNEQMSEQERWDALCRSLGRQVESARAACNKGRFSQCQQLGVVLAARAQEGCR